MLFRTLRLVVIIVLASVAGARLGAADAPAPAPAAVPTSAPAPAPAAPAVVPPAVVPAGPPLTLAQALDQAHRLNETREVAAARLDHALALRRQALSLLLPSVGASATLQKSSISRAPFADHVRGDNGLTVAVGMTLFNASSYDTVRSAGVSLSAQELDSSELRRALAFQVVTGYLDVIGAEGQLDAAGRRRAVAAQTADETRARVKAGVATGNDATRSDLELATADLTVTNDRQAVLAARLSLGDLVGREITEPLQDPEPAALIGRDLGEYERIALRERPDFHSTELRIRATELQARSARLGLVPTVGVQGSWGLNDSDPNQGVATSPQWTVALVAQWDLYDGGNREATAAAFDATMHEQDAAYRGVRRDLHRDLATALGAFATAEATVVQAENQLRVARINLDEVQQRFRQGLATALQAADASASLFQAESDLTSRHQDLAASRFQLRNLLGRWPLADTAPVEQEAKGTP